MSIFGRLLGHLPNWNWIDANARAVDFFDAPSVADRHDGVESNIVVSFEFHLSVDHLKCTSPEEKEGGIERERAVGEGDD